MPGQAQTSPKRYRQRRSLLRGDLSNLPVKSAASTAGEAYARRVSVAENPRGSSHLTVVAPDEALQRARPLPSDDDMAIEGLTDEEWDAFKQALADR